MNPKKAVPTRGVTPGDVSYILFRHKWLVIGLLVVTVVAALVVRAKCQVPYVSEAKVMIKYVHEEKPPDGQEAPNFSLDVRGENAVNSEIEVLTSGDLAATAVDVIGPGRILAKVDGSTNRNEAIAVVRNGLTAVTPGHSDVVDLFFSHPDPDMVQPILSEIIIAYKKKHHEIHHGSGYVEQIQKHMEEVESALKDIDRQYQKLKQEAGIYTTIDDGQKQAGEELDRLRKDKTDAEAKLVIDNAMIVQLKEALAITSGATNVASSNHVAAVPRDKIAAYKRVCSQLTNAESQRDELLTKYTPSFPEVQAKEAEIARIEETKQQLEDKYPALTNMDAVTASLPTGPNPRLILLERQGDAEALTAAIKFLDSQMAQVETNSARISGLESRINELLRQKASKDAEYTSWSRQLDQEKVKEEVGSGTNISPVEEPQAPARDRKKFNEILIGILLGGIVLAFGLPFVIEIYVDRTLKRPLDVKSQIGLPFFISIPLMNGNGGRAALKSARKQPLLNAAAEAPGRPADADRPSAPHANGNVTVWEHKDALQPFYETLRDRLMTYFEVINLTHKPKLVAVTSCGAGAGVTSTAFGLAESLSETGDGNVLLVNMNDRDGEAQHFYKGKLTCGLDQVLEKETRDGAFVQGNLYVAEGGAEDERLPRVLPKRFSHLLPKMKASDFDYIIFDMPPVNQISITPRLARFMDMVLLVIESGKTDRDAATRAASVLSETKTNVGVVLNKNRSFGPGSQHQDI